MSGDPQHHIRPSCADSGETMAGRVAPVPLVVVAASARALAECLRRADLPARGAPLLAVDAFGDDDLLAVVDGWQRLALADLRHSKRVVSAVDAVLRMHGAAVRADVLLGGGFDGAPEVLDALSQRHRLLNASPEAWFAARDPLLFGRLGIAVPETRLTPPADPRGWLCKTLGSSAGLGVGLAADRDREQGDRVGAEPRAADQPARVPADGVSTASEAGVTVVWQRRVAGTSASLLFCAHSGGVRPIGFNRQWCSPTPGQPFRFGGLASGFDPGATARAQMLDAATRVTAATGLRGLCSLDAVVDSQGRVHALELNPRPTASVELYDRDALGLLRLHFAAVIGEPLPEWDPPTAARALALVYAPVALRLVEPPAAAADWRRGAEVGAGEPLCTIHATGPDATAAMRRARSSASHLIRAGFYNRLLPAADTLPEARARIQARTHSDFIQN